MEKWLILGLGRKCMTTQKNLEFLKRKLVNKTKNKDEVKPKENKSQIKDLLMPKLKYFGQQNKAEFNSD